MQRMPTDLYDAPEIEYLDGIPHPKVSPRLSHAVVQRTIANLLASQAQNRGVVGTELRCYPPSFRGKRTELVPDVAYVAIDRLSPLDVEAREKPPFSPDIVVEVRSPSDNLRYLAEKIERYLATGSVLVLDVDPKSRQIRAHSAEGARIFSAGERLHSAELAWLDLDIDAAFADLRF